MNFVFIFSCDKDLYQIARIELHVEIRIAEHRFREVVYQPSVIANVNLTIAIEVEGGGNTGSISSCLSKCVDIVGVDNSVGIDVDTCYGVAANNFEEPRTRIIYAVKKIRTVGIYSTRICKTGNRSRNLRVRLSCCVAFGSNLTVKRLAGRSG